VIKLDKGVGGPKRLLQFLAGNHFSRPLQQNRQDAKGLLLQLDLAALCPHLTC